MASNTSAVQRVERDNFKYQFRSSSWPLLDELKDLMNSQQKDVFGKRYGNLLSLLDAQVEDVALQTLLQFYDPVLHCFTFQDYQLAPTLEEYSHLLDIKVTDHVPFIRVPEEPDFAAIAKALYLSLSDVKNRWRRNKITCGLNVEFLKAKAQEKVKEGCWDAFYALLAVLIYGVVLFPDVENLVELAAICVFMNKNPVPTILADTYYAIHSRHGKKGFVVCCVPLLFKWFMAQLPITGFFVESSLKWAQKIMALTSFDIKWHRLNVDSTSVVASCGGFSNVPLVGLRIK